MAVDRVMYTLAGNTESMDSVSDTLYTAKATVPATYGEYLITVMAYDGAGNVAVAHNLLEVSEWIPPKTNWTAKDRFNISDFNRIRGNFLYLHRAAISMFPFFNLRTMGKEKTSYKGYWEVAYFNAFEENLDLINSHIHKRNYGTRQVFYENGIFIGWQELNRIEGACLTMREILALQAEMIPNLSFRLGTYKEVKI